MQNQAKKLDMQKLLAPLALVILYIVFSIFGTNFLSLDMVKNILESSYYIGFMAFGVTFIIITGGIDLSLGTVMMCAALLGGYTFKQGWPLIASVVLTILVGVVFGFINGNLVAKLRLPPFIATLGTQMMAGGLGSLITKVQSQTWPTATAEVGGWFKKVFIRAELFGVKGFPVGVFWLAGFFIIAALILVLAIGITYTAPIKIGIVSFSGLAVASIVGIALNAILPGKDYEFVQEDKGSTSVDFKV